MKQKPVILDIFCGCGGLSEGFRQAGFQPILGIDIDEYAIATYNKYNNNKGITVDIKKVNANFIFKKTKRKQIDVLTGGPPCQAFSHVASAKWKSLGISNTLNHPTNMLYKEFLRLVLEIKPKFFVMENVERMLSVEKGQIIQNIQRKLDNKYNITFYIKDVAEFGVPQHRKRAIVIGNRIGVENPKLNGFHSDKKQGAKPFVTVREAISDLPKIKPGEGEKEMEYPERRALSNYAKKMKSTSRKIHDHIARNHNDRDKKIFKMLKPGQWLSSLPNKFNPYRKDIFLDKIKKQPWNKPSSTILAHLSKDGLMFIHPDNTQNRSLTPREAARLQSFSDKFVFEGPKTKQYVQIGNAVPPLFAKAIAKEIMQSLKKVQN